MLEIVVFVLAFAADWIVKRWAMLVLSQLPVGGTIPIIEGTFWLQYAENDGHGLSWLRDPRNKWMIVFRIFLLVLILVLLFRYRKTVLRPITRFGLTLFLVGMVGNQFDYIVRGFVPDMFTIVSLPAIFNLADVFVVLSVVILSVRFVFFEGRIFVHWMIENMTPPDRIKRRRRRRISQMSIALPAPKVRDDAPPTFQRSPQAQPAPRPAQPQRSMEHQPAPRLAQPQRSTEHQPAPRPAQPQRSPQRQPASRTAQPQRSPQHQPASQPTRLEAPKPVAAQPVDEKKPSARVARVADGDAERNAARPSTAADVRKTADKPTRTVADVRKTADKPTRDAADVRKTVDKPTRDAAARRDAGARRADKPSPAPLPPGWPTHFPPPRGDY